MSEDKKHFRYGPSSAHRWVKCPSSLQKHGREDGVSDIAGEGTIAHKVVELTVGKSEDEIRAYLGVLMDGFTIDNDMVEGAILFHKTVAEYCATFDKSVAYYEKFLDGRSTFGVDFGGTPDCLIYGSHKDGSTDIVVIDYKFGFNPVEATRNLQLLSYCILAETVAAGYQYGMEGVIVQLRVGHPEGAVRHYKFTENDKEVFHLDMDRAIKADKKGLDIFEVGSHCQYCRRQGNCPELAGRIMEIPVPTGSALHTIDMTPEKTAQLLKMEKPIMGFYSKLKQHAVDLLGSGVHYVPGYKLVETYGRRKWSVTEEELLKLARNRKLKKSDMYDQSLKSPSQVEKIAGKKFTAGLTTVETTGVAVAPESDKRVGVDIRSISKEFKNVEASSNPRSDLVLPSLGNSTGNE